MAVWAAGGTASCAAAGEGHASVRLVADATAVVSGQPFRLGVWFQIEDGWHIYWKNPGEAGLATAIEWRLPEGFQAEPLRWPVPRTFDQGGGVAGYGYEDAVLLWSRVRPPDTLRPGASVALAAEVSWLACKTLCVPGEVGVELTLPVAAEAEPAKGELFATWERRLPVPAGSRHRLFEEHIHGGIPWDAKTGRFHVSLLWTEERSGVAWLPAPGDGLLVERVSVRHKGRETHITFHVTRLQEVRGTALASLVVFESKGRQRGAALPIPLRSDAHDHEHGHEH
jgi:hypothetical protein